MDLLVSYDCGRYGRARAEIFHVLRRLGEEHGEVERTSVDGIALARTVRDAREIVRGCRRLDQEGYPFEFAIKWAPVDYWCATDLDRIRALLEERIRAQIGASERWGLQVARHRWDRYHTHEIIARLAPAIDRRVDLAHPDKLIRIDVLGRKTAVSILRPGDVFSARRGQSSPSPAASPPGARSD